MKKICIVLGVLILLALAGVIASVVYLRSGAAIGIDEKHPLGQLEKVETYLVNLGLEKDESSLNSIREMFGGNRLLYYVQSMPEGSDEAPDAITVAADSDGVIQKVSVVFRRDTQKKEIVYSKVKVIAKFYWIAAGGSDPDFRSADPKKDHTVEFVSNRVRGAWTRSPTSEKVKLESR